MASWAAVFAAVSSMEMEPSGFREKRFIYSHTVQASLLVTVWARFLLTASQV